MGEWNGFGGLDLADVEAERDRKSLRPGNYITTIVGAEVRDTKSGGGKVLWVEFRDNDSGLTISDVINLKNRSSEAERIGLQKLKSLLVAAHHPNPNKPGDVASLKGLTVGLRIEQGEDWTDRDGQVRPGGGKVRRSGAFFDAEKAENERIGPAPTPAARMPKSAGGTRLELNDEIPF